MSLVPRTLLHTRFVWHSFLRNSQQRFSRDRRREKIGNAVKTIKNKKSQHEKARTGNEEKFFRSWEEALKKKKKSGQSFRYQMVY